MLGSQVCGQCHSVFELPSEKAAAEWAEHGLSYRPGDVLTDTRRIVGDGETHFWPDGMVRVRPEHLDSFLVRAQARSNLGDHAGAVEDLREALKLVSKKKVRKKIERMLEEEESRL